MISGSKKNAPSARKHVAGGTTEGYVVWLEAQADAQTADCELRGIVERMTDSERLNFDTTDRLVAFLRGSSSEGRSR